MTDEKALRHLASELSTLSKDFNHLRNKALEEHHAERTPQAGAFEVESETLDEAINQLEQIENERKAGPLSAESEKKVTLLHKLVTDMKGKLPVDRK
ncbi:hypothetical protein [Oecophyllibacter saccharovorans]|uniref:DUF465 domain-containing protein n=1 Tax=Oecophyllibacter saccharovorans TaxID=2558360 RepID=A0A506ULU4_9PROT|nr:hypothetical protein [Oecophyllibacter saccharovorans]TPW34153.1 hypothetical protein E3202_06415 [Oecophyllibacter saccharovorans]